MPRHFIVAAVIVALSACAAHAQIKDITNAAPDDGTYRWNMWPPITRAENPEDAGRERDIDLRYRETLRTKIPNRKPANDPWRSIRTAPPVPFDKHRTE